MNKEKLSLCCSYPLIRRGRYGNTKFFDFCSKCNKRDDLFEKRQSPVGTVTVNEDGYVLVKLNRNVYTGRTLRIHTLTGTVELE